MNFSDFFRIGMQSGMKYDPDTLKVTADMANIQLFAQLVEQEKEEQKFFNRNGILNHMMNDNDEF